MKNLLMLVVLSSMVGILSGCNTVQGVGEDVSATGQAVERAAKATNPQYRH